ncbi:hypothetical protein BDV95DRAFT_279648, partial [Massariosphaeria phaeospora]
PVNHSITPKPTSPSPPKLLRKPNHAFSIHPRRRLRGPRRRHAEPPGRRIHRTPRQSVVHGPRLPQTRIRLGNRRHSNCHWQRLRQQRAPTGRLCSRSRLHRLLAPGSGGILRARLQGKGRLYSGERRMLTLCRFWSEELEEWMAWRGCAHLDTCKITSKRVSGLGFSAYCTLGYTNTPHVILNGCPNEIRLF